MTSTISKKQNAIDLLAAAANAMDLAVTELNKIKNDKAMYQFIGPDAGYYQAQIEELLECDHGEAGLKPLIDMLIQRQPPTTYPAYNANGDPIRVTIPE